MHGPVGEFRCLETRIGIPRSNYTPPVSELHHIFASTALTLAPANAFPPELSRSPRPNQKQQQPCSQ